MSRRMGEHNLALALEGRAKAAHGNGQLLVIAEALAALPDPEIDQTFMLALEQRLLTDEIAEQPTTRRLQAVPAFPPTPAEEVVRRAQVVQMPKRRFTVRRSVAAIAAAASLAAFPLAAVASSSLPGSPFYGAELRMERIQLALFGTPVEDGFTHLRLAEERVAEAEQLAELGGSQQDITLALQLAQAELKMAKDLVLGNTTDPSLLRRLSAEAAGAEESLRDAAGSLAQTGAAFDQALGTSMNIQDVVARLLGLEIAAPGVDASTAQWLGSGSPDEQYAQQSDDPNGSSGTRSKTHDPIDDDGNKKPLDPGHDGCAVMGSETVLGDALAPLTKLGCG